MKNEAQTMNGVTLAHLEKAFEEWERGFRAEPSQYRTNGEVKRLGVSQVSVERAYHFWALLMKVRG